MRKAPIIILALVILLPVCWILFSSATPAVELVNPPSVIGQSTPFTVLVSDRRGVRSVSAFVEQNGVRYPAAQTTDHILAWVSRQQGHKWFLWAHYIDPHGRYVAHPDVIDYGSSEPDLYDAEIKWTDQEIGRLLDQLRRLPSFANTIIIITSDHGDSMGEHNVPLGTHGTALYRELTVRCGVRPDAGWERIRPVLPEPQQRALLERATLGNVFLRRNGMQASMITREFRRSSWVS